MERRSTRETEYGDARGLVQCAACRWAGGWWEDKRAGIWVRCNGCSACWENLVLADIGRDRRATTIRLDVAPAAEHIRLARVRDAMGRGYRRAEAEAMADEGTTGQS